MCYQIPLNLLDKGALVSFALNSTVSNEIHNFDISYYMIDTVIIRIILISHTAITMNAVKTEIARFCNIGSVSTFRAFILLKKKHELQFIFSNGTASYAHVTIMPLLYEGLVWKVDPVQIQMSGRTCDYYIHHYWFMRLPVMRSVNLYI